MSSESLLVWSKILSLLVFFPIFVGACFWAYRGKNKDKLEAYAYLPLHED